MMTTDICTEAVLLIPDILNITVIPVTVLVYMVLVYMVFVSVLYS